MKGRAVPTIAVPFLAVLGCGGGPLCSPKDINDALHKLGPKGGTVEVGACTVNGPIILPANADLEGRSPDLSIIDGGAGHAAVTVQADRGTTRIAGLRILTSGPVGILARGGGELAIESVTVEATAGVAVAAEGIDTLSMKTVRASGPVTAANVDTISAQATPMETATHGVVLVKVSAADLEALTVAGFARAGVLLVDTDAHWTEGSASDNLGLGIKVEGGRIDFENVSVCRTLGRAPAIPAVGLAVSSSASVTTSGLKACDNQGMGVLQQSGTAVHAGLDLEDNKSAALWAEGLDSLDLSGKLSGNRFAGVVLVDTKNTVIHDAQISSTGIAAQSFGGLNTTYRIGDGVHMVRSADTAVLRDVTLSDNERTGVLVELGGTTIKPETFDKVSVTVANDSQHAAVAEDGVTPDGWDVGIARAGTTASVDQSFAGRLEFVPVLHAQDVPAPSDLSMRGLSSLVGL